ncbi:vacuolar sorting-associated protein [Elsinoe ampelina]|uniref:Vacuolar protein sorting-associated protein 17 n=1 Tax=Elsinoe ampelina TaxID=302913 RepID=A0A6A6G372_9PEZI|nr:vacuolar sorting-associated protein [Elsinoe ampelina]
MDYSSLPHDPEHPEGSSPWAVSPKQSRDFGSRPDLSGSANPQSPFGPNSAEASNYSERPSTSDSTAAIRSENGDGPQSPYIRDSPEQSQNISQQGQQQQYQQQGGDQQRPQQAARYHPRQPQKPQPQYKLQCKITALERTGKKDPILRFDAYTNLPKFRTTQFRDIRRTHHEFQKFAEHLIASNPEAMVPAIPPPVTAAGAGTDEDEVRVKTLMQRWLNVVCSNDILIRDEEMVFFIESDFGYSPVVRRKQPATGARRKYIKQFAPPPDDTPELLEARPIVKAFYLGAMDAGQRLEKVVKARRALGLAESSLGQSLQQLTTTEGHPGLGNAYRKLSRTIQTVGDFHSAQGTAEATTLGDPLTYHSSDASIVKETLTNRHILLRDLIAAQQHTHSRESAANRLKSSSSVKRDKVDEAITLLEEARNHEQYLAGKTRAVTANLLQEKRRWFDRTSADMRVAIREYVLRQIEAERRTLANLELVRPDVRNVDASGGLSRLGRENFTVRRALGSSQGPKGDAWSGVPRRPDGVARSMSGSFLGEEGDEGDGEGGGQAGARKRAASGAGSLRRLEEDDEDRVDARNAASRLATTTF